MQPLNPLPFFAPDSFAGLRVLYVEDEPTFRETVALLLEAQGCRVSAVKDGLEALAVIEQQPQPFPVVITDGHMPRMDGPALVRKLNEVGYPARVIVFSSAAPGTVAEEFKGLPVDAVVEKTNSAAVLLSAVKRASLSFPGFRDETAADP